MSTPPAPPQGRASEPRATGPAGRITRRAAAAGLLAASLAACTRGEEGGPPAASTGDASSPSASATSPAPEQAAPAESTAAATPDHEPREPAEVAIGQTFTDPETDDALTIVSALRDALTTLRAEVVAAGGEVILLQVAGAPGARSVIALYPTFFSLLADGTEAGADLALWDEITASGRTPLDATDDGTPAEGWLALVAPRREETYRCLYLRPEASRDGVAIPAFRQEITIPEA
ncbi:hypothetical protein BF93_12150 [Brachybacterium phenoliresistens]|uniref:Uncharacterized protein n=1 Tax=Brachybacterium phenoliresistens TaxID=396014 RepID=Z9JXG2_9MICO|nr:hypothetical protein [Brachybacterium phenoliresistens]EWS82477.1 hypothetical protein BF93_12150 [Brachybacterium phenoliresistens]